MSASNALSVKSADPTVIEPADWAEVPLDAVVADELLLLLEQAASAVVMASGTARTTPTFLIIRFMVLLVL
jgi:hypothetical protein